VTLTRDQVAAVFRRHVLATIDRITDANFDSAKSLGEMGADSIDIVEVIAGASDELGVRIPRPRLQEARTVDGLIDLLHSAASQ